jgi:CheY-like chemotaxis protein
MGTPLALILGSLGRQTFTVSDGKSAMQMALEHRPEVIFLDIGLPGVDGLEVSRKLRGEPWAKSISSRLRRGGAQASIAA